VTAAPYADERLPATHGLPRLFASLAPGETEVDLVSHVRRLGRMPLPRGRREVAALLHEVERAGLVGHGGAAFPTARKLRAVAEGRRSPVVIANGSEGEPASSKDAALLRAVPHLVLDGLQAAAAAVGAKSAYIAVHRGRGGAYQSVKRALLERSVRGVDAVEVELVTVPDRFLSGQASALVRAIGGGPALPTFAPPAVHEKGLSGRPTLVQNVETLAHLALIARHGAEWFRSVGTPSEPGTFLASVSGAVARPGVLEVAFGTSLSSVLEAAGGLTVPAAGFLLGGYHGAWLPPTAEDVPMTHADLRAAGSALGAGVVVALPEGSCALRETARVVRYLAQEGAQQCGPCLNGLPAIAAMLERVAAGHGARGARIELERYAGLVAGRGACHHPDGVVNLVRSTLTAFAGDVARHEAGHPCRPTAPTLPVPVIHEVGRR
jgi:NADH:ubiquinone oxidoreductase subunit F (NADH-binding)